jgi:glycerol uptake facilitator-like aquaporin
LSGAHFNPCVSLYAALRGEMDWGLAALYGGSQFAAAVLGVWLAHAMFALPVLQVSAHLRDGPAQWLAEFIATFGLLLTIAGTQRFTPGQTPMLVGLYITGAYWFTASTSFANPAVTLARMLTGSFAGIAPSSVPGFMVSQVLASLGAAYLLPWLFAKR